MAAGRAIWSIKDEINLGTGSTLYSGTEMGTAYSDAQVSMSICTNRHLLS